MKVVVAGGSGYFGSILVRELMKKGFDTTIFDISTPFVKAKFVKGDIRDFSSVKNATKDADALIHLAGIVGDAACNKEPQLAVETNFLGSRNIAKAMEGKKILYSSTCSVYGVKEEECSEKTDAEPFSLYGITKLKGEEEILKNNDKAVAFRMATLFGLSPKMRYDLVVNEFIRRAKTEGKITVFGGDQRRPFLHLMDASQAYIAALEKDVSGVFNLSHENMSILELAEKIKKNTGCEIEVLKDVVDKRNYEVSYEKAKKLLNFNPNYKIEDAVKEIL